MISACIITRNQQEKLEKCLQHLKKYPMEIVVVDTGSVDDSKDVAMKFTEHVYDFPWVDDFAAAKNYAIEMAPTNIVFVVDSDEYVIEFDAETVAQEIQKDPSRVGRVKRTNLLDADEVQEGDEWINRIFDKRIFHYVGRIHEQVERIDMQEYTTFLTDTHMMHDGYFLNAEERERKTERNISMLKKEVDLFLSENEDVDLLEAPAPIRTRASYLLYQLGKSYYLKQDYETAIEYFEMGMAFDVDNKQEFVIDMVETYGYAMLNAGQKQEAMRLLDSYDDFCGHADFCFLAGLIYMNNGYFDNAITEFEKAATFATSSINGVNSYLAYYNAGVICECRGEINKAKQYYLKAEGYIPADERRKNLQKS